MIKVLIFGANGQLGKSLVAELSTDEFEIITDNGRPSVDIIGFDGGEKKKYITEGIESIGYVFLPFIKKPDVVINCAASTDTNGCEINPSDAFSVNAIGAYNMAYLCNENQIPFFQISTDYVFDGKLASGYAEGSSPNPINVYGLSKYSGEKLAMMANPKTYIIRTSALYSNYSKNNLASKFASALLAGGEIQTVMDNRTFPTSCKDLAKEIGRMIREKSPYGIYHLINGGSDNHGISWYEFGLEIASLTNVQPKINRTRFDTLNETIKRPQFALLKSTRRPYLRHWKEALKEFITDFTPLA